MRISWLSLLVVSACTPDGHVDIPTHRTTPTVGGDTDPTDTDPPTDTDTDTDLPISEPVTISADCTVSPDNVLRYLCEVEVDPPGAVDVSFFKSDGSGSARVQASEDLTTAHEVWLVLMAPETAYTWRAIARDDPAVVVEGTFETDAPPAGSGVAVTVTGQSSSPMMLLSSPCSGGAHAVIVDTAGEMLWYHDFDQAGGGGAIVDGTVFTEDGTVMAMTDDYVIEVDLVGQELFKLSRGPDYATNVHHDMFRKNGLTYVLFNEVVPWLGSDFLMDGFYVFDQTGARVAEWHLIDHFQPPGPGAGFGAEDYSHTNAIYVDDDGDILLSFRHLSAIAKLNGDLADPDFGEILWRLSGDPADTDFGSDFSLTASAGDYAGFVRQHNVHWLPDGRLAMFDNRLSVFEMSRVLVLSIDEVAFTANIDEAYELGMHCDFQGGAWSTPTGNPIGTCAPRGLGMEFALGIYDAPTFEIEVDCLVGFDNYIPRFIPVDL